MGQVNGATVGFISFAAFAISVIAAVVAIDMYKLLRTGGFGGSWRILIIASVIFCLVQALRLAELFAWGGLESSHLSEIADLIFVMALAYAFYLQRCVFSQAFRSNQEEATDTEAEEHDALPLAGTADEDVAPDTAEDRSDLSRDDEWARLSGRHAAGGDAKSATQNPKSESGN